MALLGQGYLGLLKVVGFDGAVRKFDELGPHRIKKHPRIGECPKGFHAVSFEISIEEVLAFVKNYFL